jgi:hypothetical protein
LLCHAAPELRPVVRAHLPRYGDCATNEEDRLDSLGRSSRLTRHGRGPGGRRSAMNGILLHRSKADALPMTIENQLIDFLYSCRGQQFCHSSIRRSLTLPDMHRPSGNRKGRHVRLWRCRMQRMPWLASGCMGSVNAYALPGVPLFRLRLGRFRGWRL